MWDGLAISYTETIHSRGERLKRMLDISYFYFSRVIKLNRTVHAVTAPSSPPHPGCSSAVARGGDPAHSPGPSVVMPSDHMALVADLSWRQTPPN